MNNKPADDSARSLNIDIFRTFLAQWVILGHLGGMFFPTTPLVPGRLAVWCFFVISGYLNMISFQRKLDGSSWLHATRTYYSGRFRRIYPLLVFSYLIVSLVLGTPKNDDIWVLFPMVYTSTWLDISNGVLWTLIIELQLYLLTPLLFSVARAIKGWHWLLLGAVTLVMVIQIPKLSIMLSGNPDLIDDRTMLGNLGFYLFGMAIGAGRQKLAGISLRTWRGMSAILAVLSMILLYRYNTGQVWVQFTRGPYVAILASFLVLSGMRPLFAKCSYIFKFLGYYTYEIYVLHGLGAFLYHQMALSSNLGALIMVLVMPMLGIYLYDMVYKKKLKSFKVA